MLGVGAGDRADRTELADAVGGADGADAANAGISVGGIGGVEFVAGANPVDVGMCDDGILHGEREIAWYTEDVGDADVLEPAEDVLDDSWCGDHESPPAQTWVDAVKHLRRRSRCRPRQP